MLPLLIRTTCTRSVYFLASTKPNTRCHLSITASKCNSLSTQPASPDIRRDLAIFTSFGSSQRTTTDQQINTVRHNLPPSQAAFWAAIPYDDQRATQKLAIISSAKLTPQRLRVAAPYRLNDNTSNFLLILAGRKAPNALSGLHVTTGRDGTSSYSQLDCKYQRFGSQVYD